MFNVLKFVFKVTLGLLGMAWTVVQFIADVAPDHSGTSGHPGPVSRDLTMALPDELTYDGQTIID